MNKNSKTDDYIPSEDEPFMNPRQLEYFKNLLIKWNNELENELALLDRNALEMRNRYTADKNETASIINDLTILTKIEQRLSRLMEKIHYSLEKIEKGTYGFCEKTGAPISLQRLIARPIATLCVEAQEEHENELDH